MAISVQNKVMGNKHYHKRKHTFIIGKQIQMVLGKDIWHQEKHIVIGSKHGKIFGTNGGKHIHIGTKYLWGKHTIKIGKQKYTTLGKMYDTWVKLSVIGDNNFSRCEIYGNREKKNHAMGEKIVIVVKHKVIIRKQKHKMVREMQGQILLNWRNIQFRENT